MMADCIRLIVNADDFGYFPCVSRGILQAARAGAVSATGVLANAPGLGEQIGWLSGCPDLDLGVHLNLTSRSPLTPRMAEKIKASGEEFPGVLAMARLILAGRIGLDLVREEWRAQIDTVKGHGVELRFLNSHEHIHMLPGLFPLALELAEEFGIAHVRLTRAEWMPPFRPGTIFRTLLMQAMEAFNRRRAVSRAAGFIGWSKSGKLDLAYLENRFRTLNPGGVYELMCHPGTYDSAQNIDSRILAYHRWEQELELLTGPEIRQLFQKYGILVVNYRDLTDASIA